MVYSIYSKKVREAKKKAPKGQIVREKLKNFYARVKIPAAESGVFGNNNRNKFFRISVKNPESGVWLNFTMFNLAEEDHGKEVTCFVEIYIKINKQGKPNLAAKAVKLADQKSETPLHFRIVTDKTWASDEEDVIYMVAGGNKSPTVVIG